MPTGLCKIFDTAIVKTVRRNAKGCGVDINCYLLAISTTRDGKRIADRYFKAIEVR